MKRIFMLGLFSLALFGCEEKKVTEEMLIGDWRCHITQQVAKWENNVYQDYSESENEIGLIKFTKKDGKLHWGWNEREATPFDLQTIYNKPEYSVSGGNIKIKGKSVIEYISYDKFRLYDNREFTNDKNEIDNKKDKTEFSCERIK